MAKKKAEVNPKLESLKKQNSNFSPEKLVILCIFTFLPTIST